MAGDPGFKFRQGSSELLVIATLMTDEELSLSDLRNKLSLPEDYEFHYAKTNRHIREAFKNFVHHQIEVPAIIILRVDKHHLSTTMRQKRGEQLISDFITMCITNLPLDLLQNSIIYYDGEKEQTSFKNTLRATLSQALQPKIFLKDIKAVSASRNDGLQISDMLAGFIRNDMSSIRLNMVKVIQYPD